MRPFLVSIFLVFIALSSAKALDPVRAAVKYTGGGAVAVEVQLYDFGTSTNVYPGAGNQSIGSHSANSSGIISFIIGESDAAWTAINPATVTSNYMIIVTVGGSVAAYLRLDNLLLEQGKYGTSIGTIVFDTQNNVTSNRLGSLTSDDFVFGSDQLDDDGDPNHDSRLFFDKSKGTFRAGIAEGTQWDNGNVGDHSFAVGKNSKASGWYSVAFGEENTASGGSSFVFGAANSASNTYSTVLGGSENTASGFGSIVIGGDGNTAASFRETVAGFFSTEAGGNPNGFIATDRLFNVGNGLGSAVRSDAFTILKNANTTIGGSLTFNNNGVSTSVTLPTGRGTNGQVLTTDGSGGSSWTTVAGGGGGGGSVLQATFTGESYDLTADPYYIQFTKTVTGAQVGDAVIANLTGVSTANGIFTIVRAWVSSANTVTVRISAPQGGDELNQSGLTLILTVVQP
jgi:hypothetical protein